MQRASAAWYRFREWLQYFGVIYGVPVIAVNPSYTSQNCSSCGQTVVKTLSTRTHTCPHCGYIADRDENAALNILKLSLRDFQEINYPNKRRRGAVKQRGNRGFPPFLDCTKPKGLPQATAPDTENTEE